MVNWNTKFKSEYDYAKPWLADSKQFDADWRELVEELHKLMGSDGFDSGKADSLKQLRKKVKKGKGLYSKITEDQGFLQAVSSWNSLAITDNNKMRAAALVFLRHTYLVKKHGSCKVWIHSLPDAFTNWPHLHLWSQGATPAAFKQILQANNEHFTAEKKKYLANSTHQALAWCQKATILLANAANKKSKHHDSSRLLVRRWFAESGLVDTEVDKYIAKLDKGFKDIIARLNKSHLILTDYVPLRSASTQDEINFLNSEAFTFSSSGEGLDVVYIERNFLVDNPGNILKGQNNWTRIMIHELTHLVCGTQDVNKGQTRYAWYGIGPHTGYPGSDAVRNADNWAFFAVDCAGAISEAERKTALKII